jgi:hypothetical protein
MQPRVSPLVCVALQYRVEMASCTCMLCAQTSQALVAGTAGEGDSVEVVI